jgi:D-glycero-D-manno-heptose 1,7-bisphosphate phosphatase
VTRPAVFLDRDGVLNPSPVRRGRPRAPLTLEEFRPFPWAAGAVDVLHAAGYSCLVVTNQPELATGELSSTTLSTMHERLMEEVRVDGIYVCPHRREDGCECRKPRPGLVLAAARDWDVDLDASFLVGDRPSDVAAGRAAGCWTVLVDGFEHACVQPHYWTYDLRSAVTTILMHTGVLR